MVCQIVISGSNGLVTDTDGLHIGQGLPNYDLLYNISLFTPSFDEE